MAMNDAWIPIRTEITTLINDERYRLFHGRLESLEHLANAELGGVTAARRADVKAMLESIKEQYKASQEGIDRALELNDQAVLDSLQSANDAVKNAAKIDGDLTIGAGDNVHGDRDAFKAAGDVNKADRDLFKIEKAYFFAKGGQEIKEESPHVMMPVVLLVMTDVEAKQLSSTTIFDEYNDPIYYEAFSDLVKTLPSGGSIETLARYGPTPEEWRPFSVSDQSIAELVTQSFGMAEDLKKPLIPKFINIRTLTSGATDAIVRQNRILWRELRDDGCIIIMDVISMHHPVIQLAYRRSLLDVYPHSAVIKIAPTDTVLNIRQQLLRFTEYSPDLEIYKRINLDLDVNCLEVTRLPNLSIWLKEKGPKILNDREKRRAMKNPQTDYKEANRSN
jgi:hypothetical protein